MKISRMKLKMHYCDSTAYNSFFSTLISIDFYLFLSFSSHDILSYKDCIAKSKEALFD